MALERLALIVTLALGVLVSLPVAEGQQAGGVHRIGFLGSTSPSGYASQMEAFRGGLRDLGYVEGKNLVIEFRWAEGRYERLPELAAELVRLKPDVLVTHGPPGALAAKRATDTIPIVIGVIGEAVAIGAVESLARPGGNITGSSFFVPELNAKRLEILKEALPRLSRVGILLRRDNPVNVPVLSAMEHTGQALKIELQSVEVRDPADLENAVLALVKGRAGAIVVFEEAMLIAQAERIADLARRHRLPSIGFVESARAGGLLAFGVNFSDLWRRAAGTVDKILKGAKPADLPIEQATKFELVINMRTARSIGLTIPAAVLLRADQVVE
jgi:putative ABC transport system substrate-binding protein